MDEDEDEDNLTNTAAITYDGKSFMIIKSNMAKAGEHKRSRPSNYKTVEKLFIILFAFVFSNPRWCTCAEESDLFNDSRTRTNSLLSSEFEYRDFSPSSVLKRRIRHDTAKNSPNERLISFETSNLVSDSVTSDQSESSSFDYIRDSNFSDRFTLKKRKYRSSKMEPSTNATGKPDATRKFNENCTYSGARRKVSRALQDLTITLHHYLLNTSEGIVAGVVYRVMIKSTKALREGFLSTENVNGLPVGVFHPSHKDCSHVVQFRNDKPNDSQILLNWSLPTNNGNVPVSGVLFRLCYQLAEHNHTVYEALYKFPVIKGCEFQIWPEKGSFSSTDLFATEDNFLNCSLIFSNVLNFNENFRKKGLIIKLTRLNVRCTVGYVKFSFNNSAKLCGKLEEVALSNREYYYPPTESKPRVILYGKPVFALTYELVDYCYNVSLTSVNDSIVINPLLKIFCNYKISLPFGYRINITISIKAANQNRSHISQNTSIPVKPANETNLQQIPLADGDPQCDTILLRYWEANSSRVYCEDDLDNLKIKQFNILSQENQFRIRVWSRNDTYVGFYFRYQAVQVPSIVGECSFGSVSVNSACVSLVDNVKMDWMEAEDECIRKGGHLASILDEQSQRIIDEYLMKSPSYQDYNSYWIGASDIGHEGDFRWTDGFTSSYSNWFNGWPLYGYYNKQPNDDGFSSQDCVELRRQYHVSPSGADTNGSKVRLTPTFTWNDRDCRTKNYFLCEFFKLSPDFEEQLPDVKKECNQKITLGEENDRVILSSPGFPQNYPDNKNCLIALSTPLMYKIVVTFEEFVLEDEPNCSYDYLEIYENPINSNATENASENIRRFCGDWSDKLKLLRYVSSGPRLFLHFNSDYSHTFSGYKAHVSIEQVKTDCPDNRLQMYQGSCYLFVSYPQVTWQTAQDICNGVQGNLASVHSMEEHHFIVAKIRESHEYTTSTIYWLGGKFNVYDDWKWIDNTSSTFNAWVPMRTNFRQSKINKNDACLGIQWIPSPSSLLPSGLYWVPISCQKIGGYVCKIKNHSLKTEMNLNVTTNGTEGELSSPNYPGNYYHNLDYWTKILSPENTRIIIQFHNFDLEEQKDCLYDYLEIYNTSNGSGKSESVRNCGHHHSHLLHRLNFVSTSNEVLLRFHSDYSIAGSGFMASWKAVDISSCPVQTLTAKEGVVMSPNYPNFLLANLQCTTTILAPVGRQVWFEITDWDFDKRQDLTGNTVTANSDFYLFLGNKEKLYPLRDANVLTDGVYLSYGEYMRIHLKTGDAPNGRGFKGIYKTISEFQETRVVNLQNNSIGQIYHLNFPLKPLPGLNFVQRFVAPLGYSIQMQFHQVIPSLLDKVKGHTVCPNDRKGFIEVRDHFADRNGTWWQFCEAGHQEVSHLAITSYLNSITIKQISDKSKIGVLMNASLSVIPDPNFKAKILQFPQDHILESCDPNPCNNDGKCVSIESEKRCECTNHFTGLFCALTICDVNPCVFGTCELTSEDFRCVCQQGYQGKLCDKKVKPCSTNPCEGRGECIEKNNFTFMCQCHAWWEGERCEKKIVNIPYKPLTDRMLEEPFWLGLLTVFVVLSIIGLVWCARRHFPEKLEKLLAEEAERNRHYASSSRSAARADHMSHNGIATAVNLSQTNTANSSPNPRTLLGRLGIRKPSLFSLTSPLQPTHTARTFSLDDLFKPSSSRSQMSYKHRNSTSYRKKSMDKSLLKKQSSSTDDSRMEQDRRVETIELNDSFANKKDDSNQQEETSFIFPKSENRTDNKTEINNKYEKKVHFARLMSKVQAEMSSSSDVDVGSLKEKDKLEQNFNDKPLAASTQTLTYQPKSPHSTSSNQGSDSLSSSEMTLITASGEKLNSRRPSLLTLGTSGKCQKAASADSILAMFRKFSLSTGPSSECNSNFVSASTSPTISSPQDEVAGSDDSSLSSYHIPTISSAGLMESPPCSNKMHSSTIQVSVLDPLNSQKSCTSIPSSNLLHPPTILLEVPNKCLSPIHEVPTPSPSPSMTPIMPRHYLTSVHNTSSSQDSLEVKNGSKNSETSSPSPSPTGRVNPPLMRVPHQTSSDTPIITFTSSTDISISIPSHNDAKKETKKVDLVIPTFTIQEPSPIDETPAIVLCPSTPPTEHRKNSLPHPPTITVTCSGEMDSDPDCPAGKCGGGSSNTMTYLSPFSMCSRADRTASESNLSSSGYSSMASPGPSRCGSNNPLCPSEGEDQSSASHHSRRPSPLLRTPSGTDKSESNAAGQPSDSETLSDDHQMESNDEGFSTDQLDEKIKEGELKSAKELELFMGNEQDKKCSLKRCDSIESELQSCITSGPLKNRLKNAASSEQHLDNIKKLSSCGIAKKQSTSIDGLNRNDRRSKSSLQLPSIVVDMDAGVTSETRSPVSSRSESPLSDRTAGMKFSQMFYGRLTDSDGMYDWTSSDCLKPIHRKHFGRRREKLRSKSPHMKAKTNSPVLLDVPGKAVQDKWRKPSPKRRVRSHMIKASSSSSSSSESTGSHSRICARKLHSPSLKIKYSSKSSSCSTTEDVSGEDTTQDVCSIVQLERFENDSEEGKEFKNENDLIDTKLPSSQRFSIIEKLSSILSSNDRKTQWKTHSQDSASIPLLIHSHSVEENHTEPIYSKKHPYKRGRTYFKSSGLTD